ncbi:S1 RNA-binding domain-containing protein [Hymenobacter jeollabukensis]|uniref:S1 RNA-binding domain-containing protein n=1 Tax=Hymenobacter jeollabukensis TaxID=2025313 RepID=A0A5R8WJL1_9BACT|nr:S1 RNA-binding domain-containing protein [Hymenobacter jeollabukensis]TLM88870.1 S1 RNA-binding domain-containing protein [Hymenobacter jeollabukensis]
MEDFTATDPVIRAADTALPLKGLTALGRIELPVLLTRGSTAARPRPVTPGAALDVVKAHLEVRDIVQAEVLRRNTGGYVAQVLGREAFIPGSHSTVKMATVASEDDPLVGKTIPVLILEIKPVSKQLVVSHREAKQELAAREREAAEAARMARQQAREALMQQRALEMSLVSIGHIIEGQVDYCNPKFIALRAGALTIRVGLDELGWGRDHPVPELGDIKQVVITSRDEEKMLLHGSIRLLTPDPWLSAEVNYPPQKESVAKVINIANFGLFVELEPGVEGLLHRSAIPDAPADVELKDHFSVGDEALVLIEHVDAAQRRLSVRLPFPLSQWPRFKELLQRLQSTATARDQALAEVESWQAQAAAQVALVEQQQTEHALHQEQWHRQADEFAAALETARLELDAEQKQRQEQQRQQSQQLSVIQTQLEVAQQTVTRLQSSLEATREELSQQQASNRLRLSANQQLEQRLRTAQQQATAAQREAATAKEALRATLSASPGSTSTEQALYARAIQELFYETSSKSGYPYHCLISYLPTRVQATPAQQQDRQCVYNFKDGQNPALVAYRLATTLLRSFSPVVLQQMMLVVIPASTQAKTKSRYQTFCQLLCQLTGIENGYECIQRVVDEEPKKGLVNVNKVNNLRYTDARIPGRHILLFDDVMTSGASFLQNAAALRTHGASQVTGLFLARTVDTRGF